MIKVYKQQISDLNHRTWNQIYWGLEAHSSIEIVESPEKADYIFVHWLGNIPNSYDLSKVVFFDFNDSQNMVTDKKVRLYLKRSMVSAYENGVRKRITYPNYVKPFSHASVMKEFTQPFNKMFLADRDYDVTTTFRSGHSTNELRLKLQEYLKNKFQNSSYKTHFGAVDDAKSHDYSFKYHKLMRNSEIVVTMNPMYWEGDNRLYEALASGALVLCDKLWTDIPDAFINKVHLVYYDVNDFESVFDKIIYYLNNPEERVRIAHNGFQYVNRYHTPEHRIQQILNYLGKY